MPTESEESISTDYEIVVSTRELKPGYRWWVRRNLSRDQWYEVGSTNWGYGRSVRSCSRKARRAIRKARRLSTVRDSHTIYLDADGILKKAWGA